MFSRLVDIHLWKLAKFYQIFPVFPMENTVRLGYLAKICQAGIHVPPKPALQLLRRGFAKRYLMNAMLGWAVAVAVAIS
jgi:hypothetical protein